MSSQRFLVAVLFFRSRIFEGIDLDDALPERSHPSHCLLERRQESEAVTTNNATNGTSAARGPYPEIRNQRSAWENESRAVGVPFLTLFEFWRSHSISNLGANNV